ncbi:diphthine--ammonia ligase [Pseudalkalibacillus sp. SCS-8]|uniref:Dph6-related ATP pyrophosphatase n=1 Tax=Pseudalkalibacillus nanhaiensis TaxID=3115291 RepID=UPI0032D9D7A1
MAKSSVLFWSGGKDSLLALDVMHRSVEYDVDYLLTTYNRQTERVPFHGIHIDLIKSQASALKIALITVPLPPTPTNEVYQESVLSTLKNLKKNGVEAVIHGDLYLDELRAYKERITSDAHLTPVFPLWQMDSSEVASKFIEDGYRAVICGVDQARLSQGLLGHFYDNAFLERVRDQIDPAGENGEFHTFVFDGPIFNEPVKYSHSSEVHTLFERYKFLELNSDFHYA